LKFEELRKRMKITSKACIKCRELKELDNFYTRGKYLMYLCKECESIRKKKYYSHVKEMEIKRVFGECKVF
jgi:uncharacterized protein YlaI